MPLAVASAVRFSLVGPRRPTIKPTSRILSSSSPPFGVSPSELQPACRSEPAPLLDFVSLQHIKVRKSTSRGISRPRYVPPSGFGDPLDGLLLPSPCRPCFVPTALMGFTLRSFPLSKGIRTSPLGWTHLPFPLPLPPSPRRRPVMEDRGSWALTLPRVPCVPTCV